MVGPLYPAGQPGLGVDGGGSSSSSSSSRIGNAVAEAHFVLHGKFLTLIYVLSYLYFFFFAWLHRFDAHIFFFIPAFIYGIYNRWQRCISAKQPN
jgi:hypothetical protein